MERYMSAEGTVGGVEWARAWVSCFSLRTWREGEGVRRREGKGRKERVGM